MRVLMIGPDRNVHGGISGVVNNYYEAGLNQQIDLCYIGTMQEGSKLHKLFIACKAIILFTLRLFSYDIIHINVASDSSYYRKSFFIKEAKLFRKRIVIHQHGGNFENFYCNQLNDKERQKVKKILSMADAFLVLTPAVEKFFKTILPKQHITLLPNAVKVPKIIQKEYGVHKLLFLGRLCREKGLDELLTILPQLADKYPDVKLYLGGIWEDEELRKKAGQMPGQVEWLGWIVGEDKAKYLIDCDIFVFPSYFEGQPVSVLEAMSYACGCVASNIDGIATMLENGKTGILVNPGDAVDLLRGLDQMLQDSKLCKQMGSAARERIKGEFTLEKNIEKLLIIYQEILL